MTTTTETLIVTVKKRVDDVMVQAGLQIGAHGGVRLTQCRSVRLETSRTIPVQVDGEPCRLPPSVIHIKHRSQAAMIQRPKRAASSTDSPEYVSHSIDCVSVVTTRRGRVVCLSLIHI